MPKWWVDQADRLHCVEQELAAHAPHLRMIGDDERLCATGVYELRHEEHVLDRYAVCLAFGDDPDLPPKVWETGGRIPRIEDRHITVRDGACCIEVLGEWFAKTGDASLGGFLANPFRNYFMSQTHYERHGVWPFDERPHGLPGMVQAYAELLTVAPDVAVVGRTLGLMSIPSWKGHWRCPCGSGALRHCCGARLSEVRARLIARGLPRLLENLRTIVSQTGGDLDALAYAK